MTKNTDNQELNRFVETLHQNIQRFLVSDENNEPDNTEYKDEYLNAWQDEIDWQGMEAICIECTEYCEDFDPLGTTCETVKN